MRVVKNILAAAGLVFLALIFFSLILSAFLGGRIGAADKVAVVKLEGVIIDPTDFTDELRLLGDRKDVKAVVVRIDSPGGAVGPSQEIHSQIKRLRKEKTVVASMGTIAASGGYYAATAAEKIVANPGTITGSIGVLVEFVNAKELLDKIGLEGYVIKSGRFKDVGSPLRAMKDEERKMLQGVINDVNGQFITAVAEGRNKKTEEIARIADGRIFTGSQATTLGLIDQLGDLSDAIELAGRLAGIEGKPDVIYPAKRGFDLWKAFKGGPANITELFSGLRIMYLTPNW
jgi:protease-4